MSKDVKSVAVLPKSVSSAAATPKSQLGRKPDVKENYVPKDAVLVRKDSKLSTDDVSTDDKPVAPPSPSSLLRELGIGSYEEAEELLRAELVKARSGSMRGLQQYKHYYTLGTAELQTGAAGSLAGQLLNAPAAGTNTNQRISNLIKQHKLVVRVYSRSTSNNGPTTVEPLVPVTINYLIFRDKIPATAGTMPQPIATGANPPTTVSSPYTRISGPVGPYNNIVVRNPNTAEYFHIYKHEVITPQIFATYTATATGMGLMHPVGILREFEIPLHGVETQFAADSTTNPCVNALWFTWWTDIEPNSAGGNNVGNPSTDIWFTTDLYYEDGSRD